MTVDVIHLFNTESRLGHAGLWFRENWGEHAVLAIPRLVMEHQPAMQLAEGASLLSLFEGALCDLDSKVVPISVLSGHFELYSRGTPTLGEVICFVQGPAPAPGLAEILRRGVDMFKEARGT